MSRRPQTPLPRVATGLAALATLVALGPAAPAAAAPFRAHPPAPATASSAAAEAARIAAYWTPRRMREARPLDGGAGAPTDPLAVASFAPVADATAAPLSFNGQIFLRQGRIVASCSGTAIDTPTRRLVLTAGHCVNSGPRGREGPVWSRLMEFVPAYAAGKAPFGVFVARRPQIYAPMHWVETGNSNFDVGALLTTPVEGTEQVADAVGGGAAIGLDLSRQQRFQTFGYPGKTKRLEECDSPAVGEDRLSFPMPGPPTVRIRCDWVPGASGGGWLIDGGTVIDGVTSYSRLPDRTHTYGPYFSARNVGALVRGL